MTRPLAWLRLRIRPRTAFATPLQGDTLFGQLCWTLRHGWGEARLKEALQGYTSGQPFLVVSDALPAGHIPLPALPSRLWSGKPVDPSERKSLKKRVWLPEAALSAPMADWQSLAKAPDEIAAMSGALPQARNSLNRLTQATGKGEGFAPYTVRQWWYGDGAALDIHLRLDPERLTAEDALSLFQAIGSSGYGKDASVGLGKFESDGSIVDNTLSTVGADAWLTLAPCAPQGLALDPARSHYRPFTRYGRHGDEAARMAAPFKTPLLLAATGAIFCTHPGADFASGTVGQGLGGDGSLSAILPETVHQGYAPAIPVRLPADGRSAS